LITQNKHPTIASTIAISNIILIIAITFAPETTVHTTSVMT
jgi:hypothetical protein